MSVVPDFAVAPFSPLPFRGGAGVGGCPDGAAHADIPHPNPRSESRASERPEGEGFS